MEKEIKLYNGVLVPQIGLGTWLINNDDVCEVVLNAIKLGYRHIDTAEAYQNEEGVGKAIRACGLKREELFVTTKLAAECKTYESAKEAIEESLRKLNIGYIDLMIIHSPQPWIDVNQSDDRFYKGNIEAYKALEEYYEKGLIKAIGVSNFNTLDLANLIDNSKYKPMVNQILLHISNTDFNLLEYCKNNNIVVEAYSPIGHAEILNNKVIVDMAKKYNVSPAQICIKYTTKLGLITLPKAKSVEHLKENLDIDFSLSEDDFEVLKNVEHIDSYGDSSFWPVYGGKIKR